MKALRLPSPSRSLWLLPVLALLAGACASSGSFRDGVFRGPSASYRVQAPDAPWRPVSFSGNDLAWATPDGSLIAVNAVCEGHGDPSLKVLTDHLLIGFEAREIREREELQLDGRAALRTRAAASLDGVPVELELTALKKDGCVYDLIYTAPPSRFDEGRAVYRRIVSSFHAGMD